MIDNARYVHTNLIARDWRRLSGFYQRVLGCIPVPPQRSYAGRALEAGTGIVGASLEGEHLRLPGYGPGGPTLEIYQYGATAEGGRGVVNRPGFGHIAFEVQDVDAARSEILAHAGRAIGEIVRLETSAGATVTWCYVTDPEGNIIELQSWNEDPQSVGREDVRKGV